MLTFVWVELMMIFYHVTKVTAAPESQFSLNRAALFTNDVLNNHQCL